MSGKVYDSNTDAGTERAHLVETKSLKVELERAEAARTATTQHAMVVQRGDKVTRLLTRCDRQQRREWLEGYFGLGAKVVEDIDTLWGAAFRHPAGHIVSLGNDHRLKAQAVAMLEDSGLRTLDGDLMTIIEAPKRGRRPNDPTRTPFAFSAITSREHITHRHMCYPDERQGVMELCGVLPRDPSYREPHGYAWRCAQQDGLILAFGTDLQHTQKAFEILAA